jgi:hypothetical protein
LLFCALAIVLFWSDRSALSQGNCVSVSGSQTIEGTAPPDGTRCYDLWVEIGQRITMKVVRGRNTTFSIEGVTDAQDSYGFAAQKTMYRILVSQLMRARGSERFAIRITTSGGTATTGKTQMVADFLGVWVAAGATDNRCSKESWRGEHQNNTTRLMRVGPRQVEHYESTCKLLQVRTWEAAPDGQRRTRVTTS